MADIVINGVTYPAPKRVAFPGSDGKPVIFDLPADAEPVLNGISTRPPQTKAVYEALAEFRGQIASPFDVGADVATKAALDAIQSPAKNEAHFVTSEGRWYAWTGSGWAIASRDESAYARRIGELESDVRVLRTGEVEYNLIEGEYVNRNGIMKYAGWSRTPYIYCEDVEYFVVNTPVAVESTGNNYHCFWDAEHNYVGGFASLEVGDNYIPVPEGACYLILSQEDAIVQGYRVTCRRKQASDAQAADKRLDKTVEAVNDWGGAVFSLRPGDMTQDSPEDGETKRPRYYSSVIRLNRPQNKIKCVLDHPGEDDYQFSLLYFGPDMAYIGSTAWRSDDYIAWAPNNAAFVVFAFRRYAEANLYYYDAEALADNFVAYEWIEVNDYLRICTFNMARRWGVFRNKSGEEFSKWQIAQYLNLYGQIDPDILCMQEALGVTGGYIDTDQKYGMVTRTLSHKFPYSNFYEDTRMALKFPYYNYERVYYATQRPGGARCYTKCIVNYKGHTIGLFNTHTEYIGEFTDYRKAQFEELAAAMQAAMDNGDCEYAIACADFNSLEPSEFKVFTDAGFRIANCGTFGDKTTWAFIDYEDPADLVINPEDPTGPKIPKRWNMSCLDNIILSSNIEIQNVGVVEIYEPSEDKGGSWPVWDKDSDKPLAISDHYPLYCDISLR